MPRLKLVVANTLVDVQLTSTYARRMPFSHIVRLLPLLIVLTACSPESTRGHDEAGAGPGGATSASALATGQQSEPPWEELVDEATGIRFLTSNRMGNPDLRNPKIQQQGGLSLRVYEGGDLRFDDRVGMTVAIMPKDPRSAEEVAKQGRSLAANASSDVMTVTPSGPVVHRPTSHEDAYDYRVSVDLGDGEPVSNLFTVLKCGENTVFVQTETFGETPNERQLQEFHDAFRDGVRCPT